MFAGPEGSGKSLAARAFAAALLCHAGGCGECRDCRLADEDHHPNEFLVEPEGRDIHVDTIRTEVWQPANRTAPEPGRKVFLLREADRLSPQAADTLLKVLEEPPADAVLVLLSARAHELPDTVLSRCHVVTFTALPEAFVVDELVRSGADEVRARLAARLAGGNLGRARRLAGSEEGMRFRDAARSAIELAADGPAGALEAAGVVLQAAADYKKGMKDDLAIDLAPFLDDRGTTGRGLSRSHQADRDPVPASRAPRGARLRRLGAARRLRSPPRFGRGRGGRRTRGAPQSRPGGRAGRRAPLVVRATRGMAAVEEARAALAEDINLNTRLVLERAFLRLGDVAA